MLQDKLKKNVARITGPLRTNKDFDFVGWVIKTPCVFYFRSVQFHYVKETHDINSRLTTKQIICQDLLTIENTDSDLKVHALHYANELLVLAFQEILQTRQTSRNNKKLCRKRFWLWLLIL